MNSKIVAYWILLIDKLNEVKFLEDKIDLFRISLDFPHLIFLNFHMGHSSTSLCQIGQQPS